MRMTRSRWFRLGIGLLLAGGAAYWAAGAGYRAYYARDAYRRSLETDLQQFFGLPVEVGRTEAARLGVLALHDVRVWLPERRDQVFEAPVILWHRGGAHNSDGSLVEIRQAVWTLGSEAWEEDDFSRILRASLQHDYSEQRIREIILTDSQLRWPRRDLHLTAEGVNGRLDFAEDGTGRGVLTARSLNGHPVADPVQIDAQVDPRAEKLLPEVRLVVPTLPLNGLGLERLAGAAITQGTFAGQVVLFQSEAHEEAHIRGELKDLQLAQVTAKLPGGALPGMVNLNVEDVVVRDRRLESLVFQGHVQDLQLDNLLARWGLAGLGGNINLEITQGIWRADQLERVQVSGLWEGASLEKLTALLLRGDSRGTLPLGRSATAVRGGWRGQLRLKIDQLLLEHNDPISGTVDVEVVPHPGQTASIERSALLDMLAQMGATGVPERLLPQRVQFSQMGVRITVDRGRLLLSSGKGPAGPALMTLRMLGQDLPFMSNWHAEYDLAVLRDRFKPVAEQWRGQMREKLRQRLYPTSVPASRPEP